MDEDKMGRHCNGPMLNEYMDRFPKARVLVIGDIIMDEYIWGDVSRISPEAPVPVVEVVRQTKMVGGAANVVHNIARLGAKPVLCGVVGDDRTGRDIGQGIEDLGLSTGGIVEERGRPTTIKTRVVAHHQQVVRYDRESRTTVTKPSIEKLLAHIHGRLERLDAIVVSDYGKGVISADLMRGLRDMVEGSSVRIAVDPKTGNFEHYRRVDVITPNHHEAGLFCGFRVVDEATLVRAGRHMLEELDCRSVLITQGKEGMTLFENSGDITHIPTVAKKVFDVTGAGDTVIGAFSLGLASGMDLKAAAVLSNFAAGIVVGEVGTSTVSADELRRAVNQVGPEGGA